MRDFESNEDTLSGLLSILTDRIKKDINKSLPCIVTAVSDDRQRVSVLPLIRHITRDGNSIPRSEIEGLTVFTDGAGGFLISFPVNVGDLGWIDTNDRDISLFLQSYGESDPQTRRKHSFSDARFMPDIMTNYTISEADSEALVIQNRTGTVKIALDDEIRITKDTVNVTISGDSVTGVAPGGFNLNGATIDASGAIASPVSLSAPSVIADGKELAGHDHPAGTPPGNTGPNN